jgi:hypothetical protein
VTMVPEPPVPEQPTRKTMGTIANPKAQRTYAIVTNPLTENT